MLTTKQKLREYDLLKKDYWRMTTQLHKALSAINALEATNAELLEALDHIVDLRPTPGLPADTWAIIFTAIRKAKEK